MTSPWGNMSGGGNGVQEIIQMNPATIDAFVHDYSATAQQWRDVAAALETMYTSYLENACKDTTTATPSPALEQSVQLMQAKLGALQTAANNFADTIEQDAYLLSIFSTKIQQSTEDAAASINNLQ